MKKNEKERRQIIRKVNNRGEKMVKKSKNNDDPSKWHKLGTNSQKKIKSG